MNWKSFFADWFLLAMTAMVVLATLFPEVGRTGGTIHADQLSDIGIFAIFFLYGVNLSLENLRAGFFRWRLHVVAQSFTFIVFPLLFLPFRAAFGGMMPPDLLLGFFYVCALPSTISSSVAMTAMARGNVPGAIFNATLSSLLGIFITPTLVSLVAQTGGQAAMSLSGTIAKVALLLLLPFVLGQAIRPFAGAFFARYRKYTAISDKCVILLLVFSSFSDSVLAGLWTNYGYSTLAIALGGSVILLAIVLSLTTIVSRWLGFTVEDEIAAVLCGSKKTLASGVPMAKLIFAGYSGLGMIVLPIMFYHQIQLFVCSVLASRYAARASVGAVEVV